MKSYNKSILVSVNWRVLFIDNTGCPMPVIHYEESFSNADDLIMTQPQRLK